MPNSNKFQLDLWTKKNKAWILNKSDIVESFYVEGKKYEDTNNSLTGFFGNFDGLIYEGNREFYYYYYPYKKNVITPAFDIQKDH